MINLVLAFTERVKICPAVHRAGITNPDNASRKGDRKQCFSQGHVQGCSVLMTPLKVGCFLIHWEILISKITDSKKLCCLKFCQEEWSVPLLPGDSTSLWCREALSISTVQSCRLGFWTQHSTFYLNSGVFKETGAWIDFPFYTQPCFVLSCSDFT